MAYIDYETARIAAELIYGTNAPGTNTVMLWPPGFVPDQSFGMGGCLDLNNGFYAYAGVPVDSTSKTRLLVFRGTEMNSAKDLYEDVSDIGFQQFSLAQSAANDWIAGNVRNGDNTELVGHSLGGALVWRQASRCSALASRSDQGQARRLSELPEWGLPPSVSS